MDDQTIYLCVVCAIAFGVGFLAGMWFDVPSEDDDE